MTKNRGHNGPLAHLSHIALLSVVFGLLCFSFMSVNALTITESFGSVGNAPRGTLVSIQREQTETVELASFNNDQYLVGVVSDRSSSAITVTGGDNQIYVTTNGEVTVLVSDANGAVREGDFIGVSWLEGVGMKALSEGQQEYIGIALEDFNPEQANSYGEIKTSFGDKDIAIDSIAVRLLPRNDQSQAAIDSSSTGFSVFGRTISSARVMASAVLFGLGVVIAGVFVFSSLRGSFISLGRNPLASKSINKGMLRVAIVSVGIILISATSAYLVVTV